MQGSLPGKEISFPVGQHSSSMSSVAFLFTASPYIKGLLLLWKIWSIACGISCGPDFRSKSISITITVDWNQVCKPLDEGGLNIRRLADVNKAMLLKLAWSLKANPSCLWSRYMRAKSFHKDGQPIDGYKKSTIWLGIGSRLWRKIWAGSLEMVFPSFFGITTGLILAGWWTGWASRTQTF